MWARHVDACAGSPARRARHEPHTPTPTRKWLADGGASQQKHREAADKSARRTAQTGDKYLALLNDGLRYDSNEDWIRAAKAYREAITLRPEKPVAYCNLGGVLSDSGHYVEAAQRYLEAKERLTVGSKDWAEATARAFDMMLKLKVCDEVAKPEWWNDQGLKALSARVVRAAPKDDAATKMRAAVLSGVGPVSFAWEVGTRSAAELEEAATYFDRAAATNFTTHFDPATAVKAQFSTNADWCRSQAQAMQ
eukprot:scaffold105006_cov69-Phaeocystis_antarctica.AAC.2